MSRQDDGCLTTVLTWLVIAIAVALISTVLGDLQRRVGQLEQQVQQLKSK